MAESTEPAGDPSGESGAGQDKGTELVDYVVYEASGDRSPKTGAFATLTALGVWSGTDEAEARWACVDDDEERTKRSQGEGDELYLKAIPVRLAPPKLTKLTADELEEAQKQLLRSKRK